MKTKSAATAVSNNDTDLLTLLKQPPSTNTTLEKTWIEILESGTSLQDFHCWGYFEGLVSTLRFIAWVKAWSFSIKDSSFAVSSEWPTEGLFQIPREILNNLESYLTGLTIEDSDGRKLDPAQVQALLPYWPCLINTFEMILARAESNAKEMDKRQWANTLRHMQSDNCPLGEETKKVAIAQYRMALAIVDEFKDIPRLVRYWQRKLGLPKTPNRGWAKIVKSLVSYLSPFYPITVQRKNLKTYHYHQLLRHGEAISKQTYEVVAQILHLAYPLHWPNSGAHSRVKQIFHS